MDIIYINLLNSSHTLLEDECDICIVGAGAAGIYLAKNLSHKGFKVILVEAGDVSASSSSIIGFKSNFIKSVYSAATTGRSFGVGGSTSKWGGLLIPHVDIDTNFSDALRSKTWMHIINIIKRQSNSVLKKLDYHESGDFFGFSQKYLSKEKGQLGKNGLFVLSSLMLPFRKKNFSFLLNKKQKKTFKLYTNSIVRSWSVGVSSLEDSSVKEIFAVANNGRQLKINSSKYIIASGAIEAARMLLELNASNSTIDIVHPDAAIGCYLSDHLSIPIANIKKSDVDFIIDKFSPRFSKGWMRSYRFLESKPPIDSPAAFTHFIFKDNTAGFTLAKDFLLALQGRHFPTISIKKILFGIHGILLLGFSRFFRSVLYVSPNSNVCLQLDIEQARFKKNRITLSDDKDQYGRYVINIEWSIDLIDIDNIKKTSKRILKKWESSSIIPNIEPIVFDKVNNNPYDAFHPVGTCSMGLNADAVVDLSLKVRGLSNLWVVSTGVLPNAGTANPTFTMLCLAEELCDRIELD